ncbi:MAG: T9SS type A sorting domain-containing protein [Ignavibacterium sp.]|nr:MAG: T9SS type A sorting domain-containing protein [Ignavibacterium sp.]
MYIKKIQRTWLNFLFSVHYKRFILILIISLFIKIQQATAQDLILNDTTITSTAIFSANSITVGPNFTIDSAGDVILSAQTIAIIPQFFIIKGGKFQVISGATPTRIETEDTIIPSELSVGQNYPNPFNPLTKIKFSIPQKSNVIIKVFDILGNEIKTLVNAEKPTGTYEITWYAESLPSGIYFYRLQAGDYIETKKMVLLR